MVVRPAGAPHPKPASTTLRTQKREALREGSTIGGSLIGWLNGPGFLGTRASMVSDLALIFVTLSALMLTVGWQLARRRRFAAHRWVQTSAVILNTLVVVLVMLRAFFASIAPGIPARLGESIYALTTLHALAGASAVLLGSFVVLRANGLMPRRLQFQDYKPVMRTAYVLYMLATALGVSVYLVMYVLGA